MGVGLFDFGVVVDDFVEFIVSVVECVDRFLVIGECGFVCEDVLGLVC